MAVHDIRTETILYGKQAVNSNVDHNESSILVRYQSHAQILQSPKSGHMKLSFGKYNTPLFHYG